MYEDYFGLDRPPFKITPDTSLFYEGGKRGDILGALVYAIRRGEGIVKVVGEVGSGKTMLCRMLQLKLPDTVEIVYIANPSVSPEDILFVIAHELSLQISRDASKHEVMHILQDYLLKRHMENRQVVLFIEEAQGMPIETLEEVRLLSNLETDQNKLLQIILFGQPELDDNLAQQSIRQLRERITHNFRLEPLSRDEIYNYLNFRMREVGYTGPELINRALARKVEQYSEGLLRRINIIADKILLSAYAEGTHNLNAKHVNAAVEDSEFNPRGTRLSGTIWWFALILVLALLFALYQTQPRWFSAQAWNNGAEPQIAAINDKPITDIESNALETRSQVQSEVIARVSDNDPEKSALSDAPAEDAMLPVASAETQSGGGAGQSQSGLIDKQPAGAEPPASTEIRQSEPASQQTEMTSSQTQSAQESIEQSTRGTLMQEAAPAAQKTALSAPAGPQRASEAPVLQSVPGVASASAGERLKSSELTDNYELWLNAKLEESREWLSNLDSRKVSIQVMMRKKSAARELVYYLLNEWPLELSKTHLYEVNLQNRSIYRVFYNEYDTLAQGRQQLEKLPETVKNNSPYLHSVYRMQKALL
ncbi:MAG TPA: AAA family ATPase [Gammaproteobacteria bacterium]|nr:AAA family ATPase [Gammaproteobacteria bacterium]